MHRYFSYMTSTMHEKVLCMNVDHERVRTHSSQTTMWRTYAAEQAREPFDRFCNKWCLTWATNDKDYMNLTSSRFQSMERRA